MSSEQKLIGALASKINASLLSELLKEYRQAKHYNWLQDWEKSILHASRFSELIMAVIINLTEKRIPDINELRFDPLYNYIVKKPKRSAEDDILMLAIPRVAASIYSIRNKKRVAHVKVIDPDFLDSTYCISACDWILSELVMLTCTSDPREAKQMLDSIIEKKLPFIEQFEDGTFMVLKDLKLSQRILAVLYHLYPKRLPNKELRRHTEPNYSQHLTSTLANLERKRLIHRNSKGSKLTKIGIRYVEEKILAGE